MLLPKLLSLCIALLSFHIQLLLLWDTPVSSTNSEILEKLNTLLCDSDYSSLLSTLNLRPLSSCCSISKLCLLYKIINNLLYFPSHIFIYKSLPNHASRHFDPLTFTMPFSCSSASKISFVPSILSYGIHSLSCEIYLISNYF